MTAWMGIMIEIVVSGLWAIRMAKRRLDSIASSAIVSATTPYRGLPAVIDAINGSGTGRPVMRRVVSVLNPVSLVLGRILGNEPRRREWLVGKIRGLPLGSDISYVLHYIDYRGRRIRLLTRDPTRGLRPPPIGTMPSDVVAAYHGDDDVTREIRAVSPSFHASEGVCPVALDAYMRSVRGVGLSERPLVLTDRTLSAKEISMPQQG